MSIIYSLTKRLLSLFFKRRQHRKHTSLVQANKEPLATKPKVCRIEQIKAHLISRTDIKLEAYDFVIHYLKGRDLIGMDLSIIEVAARHAANMHKELIKDYKISDSIPRTPGWAEMILAQRRAQKHSAQRVMH